MAAEFVDKIKDSTGEHDIKIAQTFIDHYSSSSDTKGITNDDNKFPTSQAVYNAIAPLTDEVVLNWDEWYFKGSNDIWSDNEDDYIYNSSTKNITISQLPAIIHCNTGGDAQSKKIVKINDVNISRGAAYIKATQSYYIGINKQTGNLDIINVTQQLYPLPDFHLILGDEGNLGIILTDNAKVIKDEYYIIFWKIYGKTSKVTHYNDYFFRSDTADGDDRGSSPYIYIHPIQLKSYLNEQSSLYNVRDLILRGFESQHGSNSNMLEEEWDDDNSLEEAILYKMSDMYNRLNADGYDDFSNSDILELKYFNHPVYFKIPIVRIDNGNIVIENKTTKFSTTFGISIARCAVNVNDEVLHIVDQTEIKKFKGLMWIDRLNTESPSIGYNALKIGKQQYIPGPRYRDIFELFI